MIGVWSTVSDSGILSTFLCNQKNEQQQQQREINSFQLHMLKKIIFMEFLNYGNWILFLSDHDFIKLCYRSSLCLKLLLFHFC